MIVMKFGGTSVGTPEAIKKVGEIVKKNEETKVIVVSALSGTTNALIKAANLAAKGDKSYKDLFNTIKENHTNACNALFGKTLEEIDELLNTLFNILKSIEVLGEVTSRALDTIQSFGERMSTRIVSKYLKTIGIKSVPVDAMHFLITNDTFGNALPLYDISLKKARSLFTRLFKNNTVPVVTGFIGSTESGIVTTLGRGGSDFTATIIGNLLDAREVWIWTDVNGIMTANPKIVKNASSIKEISYNEVAELSYYGANVIYSRALLPAVYKKIPIRILNTFQPDFEGTLITERIKEEGNIKSITEIDHISLINVKGKGMSGMPDIAARIFKCAYETKSNVLMISQASSEQNICFVVNKENTKPLLKALKKEFKAELSEKTIENISHTEDVVLISVVGSSIADTPGTFGKIFSTTGNNGINVIAIAQSPSAYNLSFVVKRKKAEKAINAIHTKLGLGKNQLKGSKIVNIFQFGMGTVGKALAEIILREKDTIERESNVKLHYIGAARRNCFVISDETEKLLREKQFDFPEKGKVPLKRLYSFPANTVVVDVTNTDTLTDNLIKLLENGINVVTSNKKNLTKDYKTFKLFTDNKGKSLFETTVGAALPIIKTIKQLIATGDTIERIILLPSGSLSFIFGMINKGKSFSDALSLAMKKGYTEPNPMDDLKGMDILRKTIIIARLIGEQIEKKDVEFNEFVSSNDLETFKRKELKSFSNNLKELSEKGIVYPIAEINRILHTAKISIKVLPKQSEWAYLNPGDNLFFIYTKWYGNQPIVIKGIGAGPEVTAAGVLSDIIHIGREL